MFDLTPAERRVALLLIGLLALGALTDRFGGRIVGAPPAADSSDARSGAPAPAAAGARPVAATVEPLDLNRASSRELDALPGVGPVLAARIIEHRSRHGAFRTTQDLRAVRGIGPRLFARLEPLIRVGPASAPQDSAGGTHASRRTLRAVP